MFDVIVRHEATRSVVKLVVADPDPLARTAEVLAPIPANGVRALRPVGGAGHAVDRDELARLVDRAIAPYKPSTVLGLLLDFRRKRRLGL